MCLNSNFYTPTDRGHFFQRVWVGKKFSNKSAEATELATERHECFEIYFFTTKTSWKKCPLSVGRVEIFFSAWWCLKRVLILFFWFSFFFSHFRSGVLSIPARVLAWAYIHWKNSLVEFQNLIWSGKFLKVVFVISILYANVYD